jgi:hypothetical protein
VSDEKKPTPPSSGGGGAPAACTTGSCSTAPVVHAQIQILEITFSGNHPVEKDTLGNFPAPEWRAGVAASANSPVCYTRNTRVQLTTKFRVTQQPSASESVEVKGNATFGAATLEWLGTVTVAPSDTEVTTPALTSNVSLPNEVECYDPASITWQANAAGTGWNAAGSSSHLLYVVLGNPSGTPAYWTLLDISCRAAPGETTEAGLVSKAYDPFKGRSLTRKRDGQGLTYWNPTSTICTNTRLLLASSDGSGQCGSWSEFLIDIYKCHGVTSADKILVVRTRAAHTSATEGFLVKNWRFNNPGSRPPPWTHVMGTECVNLPGIPGQRNPDPPPAFFNHFIVKYGAEFFDPSYGGGPVASQTTWETGAIEGLFNDPLNACGFQKAYHAANLLEFWNLRTGARI